MPRRNKLRNTAMAEVQRKQRQNRLSQIEPDLIIMPNLNLGLFQAREAELAALHSGPDIVGCYNGHEPMIAGMNFTHGTVGHYIGPKGPTRLVAPICLMPMSFSDDILSGRLEMACFDQISRDLRIRAEGIELIEKIIKDIEAESVRTEPDNAFCIFMGKYKR